MPRIIECNPNTLKHQNVDIYIESKERKSVSHVWETSLPVDTNSILEAFASTGLITSDDKNVSVIIYSDNQNIIDSFDLIL